MATAPSSSLYLLHQSFICPKYPRFYHKSQFCPPPRLRYPTSQIRASSPFILQPESERSGSGIELLACPVCYEPLIRNGPPGVNLQAIYKSGFKCKKCDKSYSSRNMYLDLTVTAGMKKLVQLQPMVTELFRSPLVSFLYERGWRENFKTGGFPDFDEEFKMAQDYLKPSEGGVLVDVSCGSGLFSRELAKARTHSGVIALDFSEYMLLECYNFLKRDPTLSSADVGLVRADVCRLPFASGSVDAVHAGLALYCWPSQSNAVAEISRILRSGGIFVGTTILPHSSYRQQWMIRPLIENMLKNYNFLEEEEIQDLCTSCGLTNYSTKVEESFIMFTAQKP